MGALALVLALLGAPRAGAADAEDAAGRDDGLGEALACVRKNAPKAALVQSVELISVDRAGQEVSRAAKLYAKRASDGVGRLLLRVEEPPTCAAPRCSSPRSLAPPRCTSTCPRSARCGA